MSDSENDILLDPSAAPDEDSASFADESGESADSRQEASADADRSYDLAVVLDLDFAAVDGAEALYRACESALSEAGIPLDAGRFARFLLGESALGGINALLNHLKKPRDGAAAIAKELKAAFETEILKAPARKTAPALASLAQNNNGHFVVLTSFEPETSSQLIAHAGLPEDDTTVVRIAADGLGYQSTEAWSQALQAAHVPPRRCMAVTGTGDSARSALMANGNVAVFLGPRVEQQDFSGADFLGTGDDPRDADAIHEILKSRM